MFSLLGIVAQSYIVYSWKGNVAPSSLSPMYLEDYKIPSELVIQSTNKMHFILNLWAYNFYHFPKVYAELMTENKIYTWWNHVMIP